MAQNPFNGLDITKVPNLAISLGLDELKKEEQAKFLVDYILLLEGAFHYEYRKVTFEFDDLLDMANQLKLVVMDPTIDRILKDEECPF